MARGSGRISRLAGVARAMRARLTGAAILAWLAVVTAGCPHREPWPLEGDDGGMREPPLDGGDVADARGPRPDARPMAPDARVDCPPPELCPPVGPSGAVSICGQVKDVETSQPVLGDEAGALEVHACEAIAWATGVFCDDFAPPVGVDRCGNYRLEELTSPPSGYMVLLVVDAGDERLPTGVGLPFFFGGLPDLPLWTVRHSTIDTWNETAGRPAGAGFQDAGAMLLIFTDPTGVPRAGVTPIVGGAPRPDGDSFFADMDALTRGTIAPERSATGPNGSAILTGLMIDMISASGGELPGCWWNAEPGATVPGALLVQERRLDCP